MTYLDYQATTPMAPEALEAMLPWLRDGFANPHSAHAAGRRARAAVEVAREQIAALLPPGGRVTFTSGATEALNWAIRGAPGDVLTFATEHAAVLDCARPVRAAGRDFTMLPLAADGRAELEALEAALTSQTGLVAAMLVNNEIGVIHPVAEIAERAHRAGALMLCDAVQGFGRVAIPDGCDLIALSAHKIYGPKGIGALWVRDGVTLDPLLYGGGQEAAGRSGTLSPALCAGFGMATKLMGEQAAEDDAHVARLFDAAIARLGDGWTVNGSVAHRYRGNLNLRRDGLDVARLMSDLRDIAFSAGSACASGSGRASHVLRAIGLSEGEARSSIRIGFGRYTGEAELIEALDRIDRAAQEQGFASTGVGEYRS